MAPTYSSENSEAQPVIPMPAPWMIAEAWKTNTDFIEDLEEPACFACGWSYAWWSGTEYENWKTAWNGSRLERAHILAKSDGGSNHVSNLVLLCKRCHQDSPMTTNRQIMLNWIINRETYIAWITRDIMIALREVGVTPAEVEHAALHFKSDNLPYLIIEECNRLHVQGHPHRHTPHISNLVAAYRSVVTRHMAQTFLPVTLI